MLEQGGGGEGKTLTFTWRDHIDDQFIIAGVGCLPPIDVCKRLLSRGSSRPLAVSCEEEKPKFTFAFRIP